MHLNPVSEVTPSRNLSRLQVSGGRAGAPYTETVSSPQRSCIQFHLWPFAACHSLSLPCFLSILQLSYPRNKGPKSPKNIFRKKRVSEGKDSTGQDQLNDTKAKYLWAKKPDTS